MPKNFIRKHYDNWFSKNHHRFNYEPTIKENRKNYFSLELSTSPYLEVSIGNRRGLSVFVVFQNEWVDLVFDSDVAEKRTADGKYYCDLCKYGYERGYSKEKQTLFSSREDLWTDHCFEAFLEWSNKNLVPTNSICIYADKDGHYYSAIILNKEKIEKSKYAHILPVLSNKKDILSKHSQHLRG